MEILETFRKLECCVLIDFSKCLHLYLLGQNENSPLTPKIVSDYGFIIEPASITDSKAATFNWLWHQSG
jgi:hypothetical protein